MSASLYLFSKEEVRGTQGLLIVGAVIGTSGLIIVGGLTDEGGKTGNFNCASDVLKKRAIMRKNKEKIILRIMKIFP
jgi:hypothetical protein